ncbi:MAG TPA: deoxyguanosinetriphosphate triphosphohydrolase [Bryobacteraceae bacterium]|nr:deoxyguanosinetriphosphate triphosphohydrolase [Bryobacteraceae bacterium]
MIGSGRLRFPVGQSRGRRYPEVPHPYRNEFQRDRDRIIHCHAFRRLENKTQVFPAGVSDHFRNRLTHTIEVAQIARTVASALELDEDLTEALALGHDIGHPPFAHAGEEELDRQMRRFGERFDHNLHALHIVESFEHRYARFPGLNLTFEVREGIAKHSRDFERGENPVLDEYLPGLRPPLEAQLIDLADEVAYNTADLDDAFSANLLKIDEVRNAVPEFNRKYEEVEGQFPGATDRERCQEVVRALVDELVSGFIQGTTEAAQSAGVTGVEDIRRHPRRLAAFTAAAQATNRALKQFLHHAVYFSGAMVEARRRSVGMVAELFDFYVTHPEALPESYVESLERTPTHRIVCDYIAGMTDGFFLRTYEQALRKPD